MDLKIDKQNSENKLWIQWLATISASIGCFMYKFHDSWSSPSLVILESETDSPFPTTSSQASWIASFFKLGNAFGTPIGCALSLKYGPKVCILATAVPYIIGFTLIILSTSPAWLYASRLVSGMAAGMTVISTAIYLTTIAECRVRGALIQLATAFGMMGSLFVSALGPYVSLATAAQIMMIFPVLLLTTFYFAPEARIDSDKVAIASIQILSSDGKPKVDKGIFPMKTWIKSKLEFAKKTMTSVDARIFALLLLVCIYSDFCGAKFVDAFLQMIYDDMEFPIDSGLGVVITRCASTMCCFITIPLIDLLGRKPLLLTMACLCVICDLLLGLHYVLGKHIFGSITPIVAVNVLIVASDIGLDGMINLLAGEMYGDRGKVLAMCALQSWSSLQLFVGVKLHQVIGDGFGFECVFFAYAAMTATMTGLVWRFLPETKKKSLVEIRRILVGERDKC